MLIISISVAKKLEASDTTDDSANEAIPIENSPKGPKMGKFKALRTQKIPSLGIFLKQVKYIDKKLKMYR